MAYQPTPTKFDGIIEEVTTSDDDAMGLLKEVVIELKIMNRYFSILTEVELTKEDI